jgi:alkylation response protein AidB-like acyl-CoA dehydrogenase
MSVELDDIAESARQIADDVGIAASAEKVWPLVIELGLLQIAVPESLGGLEQGLSGASAIYRELGASLAGGPYLAAMLAIDAVCNSELPDQQEWIERMTSGNYATVALADCVLSLANDSKLSGFASAVSAADQATHLLVFTGDASYVALLPKSAAGVTLTERPTWDRTRRLFEARFDQVAVDEKLTLARGATARKLVSRLLAHRDFALACDAVGGATALLTMTVDYLQTRRQYGRPLALFQALKHRCADLKVQLAASSALLEDNLNRVNLEHLTELESLARTAKYLACSTYSRMAEEALQLHGGIAMTSEHSLHLFLKRALLDEQLGRTSEAYELDIAAELLAMC